MKRPRQGGPGAVCLDARALRAASRLDGAP
jgi:hypothetical protein